MATGYRTKVEVLAIVTDAGIRTRKDKKLFAQTFEKTLKKTVYCGYISASCLDSPVKGKHEPIVSEELFRTVQAVLAGRALNIAPKRKCNPNFPLKPATRCAACGTPITCGLATGKNKNRRFGYYWCRKPGCRSVMVRREELEATFLAYLNSLQPDEQSIADFPRIAEQAWRKRQGDAEEITKTQSARLAELRVLKSELLRAKLRGEVPQSDYSQMNAEFDLKAVSLEEQIHSAESNRVAPEAFVRFAKAMLLDVGEAWRRAGPEQNSVFKIFFSKVDCVTRKNQESLNTLNPVCSIQWKQWGARIGGWRPRRDLNPCYRRERAMS